MIAALNVAQGEFLWDVLRGAMLGLVLSAPALASWGLVIGIGRVFDHFRAGRRGSNS